MVASVILGFRSRTLLDYGKDRAPVPFPNFFRSSICFSWTFVPCKIIELGVSEE